MVGTRFVQQAIEQFEKKFPDTLVAMSVALINAYGWTFHGMDIPKLVDFFETVRFRFS